MARKKKKNGYSLPKIPGITDIGSFLHEWSLKGILCVLIVSVILFFGHKGVIAISKSPFFSVKQVSCIPASAHRYKFVRAIMLAIKGHNIFELDLIKIAHFLEQKYPEVKGVMVKRCLPDSIKIYVDWSQSFAQVEAGGFFLIDRRGIALDELKADPYSGVPNILCNLDLDPKYKLLYKLKPVKDALRLLHVIDKFENISISETSLVDMRDPECILFYLDNGIEVRVGKHDHVKKIVVLATVLKTIPKEKLEKTSYIDLRFKDVVVGSNEDAA